MARVEIASQAWGWIADAQGNGLNGASVTLENLDGTAATHWSAQTGGSSLTSALTSNSDGTLPRFIEEGTYLLTATGVTDRRVEAINGEGARVVREAPLNVKYPEYGAVGDNGSPTEDTAAFQAALAALPQTGSRRGGDIFLPRGNYHIDTLLDLDDAEGVNFIAEGTNAANQTTWLTWTGGAGSGPMISMAAADGIGFRGIKLVYTDDTFNNALIACGSITGTPTTNLVIRDCFLAGSGADSAPYLLSLDGAVDVLIENTAFHNAVLGIEGSISDFANSVKLLQCKFNGMTTAAIKNLGQSWSVDTCSFERLVSGAAGAITSDHGTTWRARGVTVNNCWFGDVTTNSGTWIDIHGFGVNITGNVFDQRGMNAVKSISLYDCDGVMVTGNNFREGSHGVEQAGTVLRGFVAIGNSFESVTNPLPNTAVTARALTIANVGYDGFIDMVESGDHTAPAANRVRVYSKDSGGGKTQLVARFNTGAVQTPATEP